MVVVPAETGEVGILQNHVPFLALLVPGEVRVKANDGQQRIFRCGEGFVTVDANEVIVAVEDASEVAA